MVLWYIASILYSNGFSSCALVFIECTFWRIITVSRDKLINYLANSRILITLRVCFAPRTQV